MPFDNVPVVEQCWFKTCRFRATDTVAYRHKLIDVCDIHALQFRTSYEKQNPNGFPK